MPGSIIGARRREALKKGWILLGISVLSLAALTACTSSADTLPDPTTQPMASASPQATMAPTVSIAPAATQEPDVPAGVNSVTDAERISEQVAEEVEKLSELDDAEAIVAGNIALVAVKYDSQYQGGMTDRLQKMIEERVNMVDKTITTVHVTDDPKMYERISELNDMLDDANFTFEQLQTKLLELGSAIAGGGEPAVTQPAATDGPAMGPTTGA